MDLEILYPAPRRKREDGTPAEGAVVDFAIASAI
jgi:hypothetical protein